MKNRLLINGLSNSFKTHKALSEKAFEQLDYAGLHWATAGNTNTVAILIKHISGHLKSRFSHFFELDGEQPSRNRKQELTNETNSIEELKQIWQDAWQSVFFELDNVSDSDLERTKILRGEAIMVADYIPRVLAHFCYHSGQIVYIAKQYLQDRWKPF